mmetsp:Transcript_19839/g.31528  ORF Transcript_19839/g.31528 Transcript_19839/m.31528 type:complete len:203 (-) Transcript_19839:190-798(-)
MRMVLKITKAVITKASWRVVGEAPPQNSTSLADSTSKTHQLPQPHLATQTRLFFEVGLPQPVGVGQGVGGSELAAEERILSSQYNRDPPTRLRAAFSRIRWMTPRSTTSTKPSCKIHNGGKVNRQGARRCCALGQSKLLARIERGLWASKEQSCLATGLAFRQCKRNFLPQYILHTRATESSKEILENLPHQAKPPRKRNRN